MNATIAYDDARSSVAKFIKAKSTDEIIFVRGATEAVNLVAHSFCKNRIQKDDEILVTEMEHHANIIPWQIVAKEIGAKVIPIAITDEGEINLKDFESKINNRTKMAAFVHVSNALGTINPAKEMIATLKSKNNQVLLDAAQAVAHQPDDEQEQD